MVKICFSQIDVEPIHPDLYVERMLQAIDEAKQNNTDIITDKCFIIISRYWDYFLILILCGN